MNLEKLSNKKILIYTLILSLIILSMPILIRFLLFDGIIPDQEPYYNIRISEHIADNNIIPSIDPLTKEKYIIIPYHLLLAGSTKLIGSYYSSILLPIIFGLLSIFIFYLILNQLKIKKLEKILTLTILIISPIFIYLFSISNQYLFSAFLILLSFYLFMQKRRIYFIFSILIFALIAIFNLPTFLFSISLLLVYAFNKKIKIKNFYIILAISTLISIIYYSYIYSNYGFSQINPFIKINFIQQLISDFGSPLGLSIFSLLLTVLGMFIVWEKRKQIIAYILFIIFIILTLYPYYLIFYLNFIIAIFAAYGLSKIIKMRWSLDLVKKLTILILFLGLIFSSISYIQRTTVQSPNEEIMDSLLWIKDNTEPNSTIFSYPSNTHFINQISKRDTFLHQPFDHANNLHNKTNITYEIYYSRNLIKTKNHLLKNNITYILITPEMKSEIWHSEDQGLLFLFRNKETFKNIYQKNNIEIWKIIG